MSIKEKLNIRAKGRKTIGVGTAFQIRGSVSRYNDVFGIEKEDIGLKNTYPWAVNSYFSKG